MTEKVVGRNDPCPCGSGKKYKRCHGLAAEPPRPAPAAPSGMGMPPGGPMGGFDPSSLDPTAVANLQKAMRRLPKGQLLKIQTLMQKAMSGKDVTREAAELERSLPPGLLQQMTALSGAMGGGMGGMGGMPGMPGIGAPAEPEEGADLSVDEARKIVERAAAEGKVSAEEAQRLLDGAGSSPSGAAGLGGLWKRVTGKK